MQEATGALPSKGNWSSEQLNLAFHFYCQTPFGKLHSRNPQIIELAELIGRTPNALAMKLVNFASLDPSITSTGRAGAAAEASAVRLARWSGSAITSSSVAPSAAALLRRDTRRPTIAVARSKAVASAVRR